MILGIETATSSCSVALVEEETGKLISFRSVVEKNIHSEKLLQFTDEIICEAKITLQQISKVAVSIGPGSFTGLRIGLSAAKGFASALNIPIVPIPTLDGLIHFALQEKIIESNSKVIAMISAKKKEAYFAKYNISDSFQRISTYEIGSIIDIFNQHKDAKFLFSKEWNESKEINSEENKIILPCSAISIAKLALRTEYLELKEFSELEPMYLRNFEPKINIK